VAKSRRVPDDDDDAPPRRARTAVEDDEGDDLPQKPRKKRESAAGPVRLILKICLGVALSIALIVLLYWIYSPVGADPDLFCYFPKETTRITGYDVGEVTKNHKLADVHSQIMSNYNRFASVRFNQTGLKDTDVDKYLFGVAAATEDEKDLPAQERRGSITVIRFRQAADQAKFLASFGGGYKVEQRQTKDGKTYHHLYRLYPVPPDQHLERDDDISFFWPNDRTLVYTSTWRECEECMTRVPGRVVVDGNMRDLANKVDGHFFQASTGWFEVNGFSNTLAFGLGIVDQDIRDQKTFGGVVGTASWFADNGNDFLYASASLYSDRATAKGVRNKLAVSYAKAQADVWQSEGGRASGLEDPFNPKPKEQPGGAGGFSGGGTSSEQTKDVLAALSEYVRNARVYSRDRLVVVEGTIPHGTPEQGIFEKFWKAVGSKVAGAGAGGGFGGPGMGMPGGGPGMGMPGGFVPPGRVP
jgi:hypothetical protein